jgi:hypothetical protein
MDRWLGHETLKTGNSVNKFKTIKCIPVKISFIDRKKLRFYKGENEICGSGTRGTRGTRGAPDAKI